MTSSQIFYRRISFCRTLLVLRLLTWILNQAPLWRIKCCFTRSISIFNCRINVLESVFKLILFLSFMQMLEIPLEFSNFTAMHFCYSLKPKSRKHSKITMVLLVKEILNGSSTSVPSFYSKNNRHFNFCKKFLIKKRFFWAQLRTFRNDINFC